MFNNCSKLLLCPAHLLHRVYEEVFVNELIFHQGCFEKMVNGFFNMSCSSITSANVFLNFRISSSSGFICPLPRNASSMSFKYLHFHQCINFGWISKPLPTSGTFHPPPATKRTTSSSNPLSKLLRSLLSSTAHFQVLLPLSLTFRCVHHSGKILPTYLLNIGYHDISNSMLCNVIYN